MGQAKTQTKEEGVRTIRSTRRLYGTEHSVPSVESTSTQYLILLRRRVCTRKHEYVLVLHSRVYEYSYSRSLSSETQSDPQLYSEPALRTHGHVDRATRWVVVVSIAGMPHLPIQGNVPGNL